MTKREITTEDLTKVKSLGPGKARTVHSVISNADDPAKLATEDFVSISGISQGMAEEIVKVIQDPDAYEPQPPTPRRSRKATATKRATKRAPKRAAKRAAKKAPSKTTTSNGHSEVKAGEIRKFARDAERLGLTDIATDLRGRVSALLDGETVSPKELVNS